MKHLPHSRPLGVLALLLATLLLASCTRIVDLGNKGETMRLAAQPATEFTAPETPAPASAEAAAGANDFAFRFAQALLQESPAGRNFLCSPYSAWLPLAALVNATDAARRDALLEALGAAGLSTEQLNAAAKDMLACLTQTRQNGDREEAGLEKHNPLSIANAVFVDQEARISSDFADVFADDYGGAAINVDFSSPDAAQAINDWASEHTQGLIPEIVTSDMLDPETVAALANAIYFSDRWRWEFETRDTTPGDFRSPNGTVEAQFMLRDGEQPYFEDEVLQAVRLDFTMGGSLLVLLPKDMEARELLASMDETRLEEVLDGMSERTGRLLLPRFRIDSDLMQITDVLGALGIPLMDEADPALTGLVDGQSLYLSEALQKAHIDVDEEGTTAAAVTVMTTAGMALPEPLAPFDMVCDSPFVFLLLGDSAGGTDQVLFAGLCADPAAE